MITTLLIATTLFSAPIRLVCPESQKRAIRVEGILNEWDQLTPLNLGTGDVIKGKQNMRGKTDLGVALRCSYVKDEGLYFLIEVIDSRIIRDKRPSTKNDHFTLTINNKRNKITVFPPTDSLKGVVKGLPKKARGKVVKQEFGYALELGIPWGQFGLQYGAPLLPINLSVYDTDSAVAGMPETIMTLDGIKTSAMTRLEFGGAKLLMDSFLDKVAISSSDVKMDVIGNFLAGKLSERAVYADRFLAIIGGDVGASFFYTPLAFDAKNVLSFKIMDLDGDGVSEFVTVFKYSSGETTWTVMSIYHVNSKGIQRLFAHMLEFESGTHFIKNKYQFRKKGKKYQAIFTFSGASKSITKKSWKGVTPDKAVVDYLYPWSTKKEVFYFSSGTYSGGR
ncbi:hypothetical protein KKF84_14045 [Myxococcota bacterium]|nr:hypothetical protein [Myxococcota bacterium]MBU1536444.1 hypothetical protein [Myxococcota bacterium]